MLKEIGTLAYTACAIRGLFVPKTFVKVAIVAEVAAESPKSEAGKMAARVVSSYVCTPVISAIEGAVAFKDDAKRLVEKAEEKTDCWTKRPVWREGR